MSSTNTSWDQDSNTKATNNVTEASSQTLSGTLTADKVKLSGNIIQASDGGSNISLDISDNVTIAGYLTVNGADITIGSDTDDADRTIVFGHQTLKSIIGIDDSANRFVINTDASFDGTIADNDFSIDSDGDVFIKGDLTVTGGKIEFGNNEILNNESDGGIVLQSTDNANLTFVLQGADGYDTSFLFYEGPTLRWSIGQDASDNTDYSLSWDYNNTTVGAAQKMKLTKNGDLLLGADGSARGTLSLWDGAGGNTPGYIVLYSPDGTANYIFCEDDGTLKRHTSAPTANGDGDAIGGQTD